MADAATTRPVPWWQAVLWGRRPRRTAVRVVILVVVSFVVFKLILIPIRVDGPSMLPTYHTGQINFVNRLAYLFREPRRGDVVSIRFSGRDIMLMKRIVGLPGETVEFRGGHLYINGNLLEEPYVKRRCSWDSDPVTVGPFEYYVVGDNRSMPIGLHEHGRAARNRIIGKVLL